MDNIKFIDTMLVVGQLKNETKEDELMIERLVTNSLEVDKIYKIINKFIIENKTTDTNKWGIIDRFVELFEECVFDGNYLDGIKEILEIYKFKHSDKHIKELDNLYKEMYDILNKFKKDYIIELDDLRIVQTYGNFEYRKGKIKASRIVSGNSLEYLLIGDDKVYAYMVGNDDKVYLVKREDGINSFICSILKYSYKLAVIPKFYESTKRVIVDRYDASYLDNEEYLRFLKLFDDLVMCNPRSVKLLDDIKKSSYDFKSILSVTCKNTKVTDVDTKIKLLERIYGLTYIASTSDKELDSLSTILAIYEYQIEIRGSKRDMILKHKGRSIKEFIADLRIINCNDIHSFCAKSLHYLCFKNGFQRINRVDVNKFEKESITGEEYDKTSFVLTRNSIKEIKDMEELKGYLDDSDSIIILNDKNLEVLKNGQ